MRIVFLVYGLIIFICLFWDALSRSSALYAWTHSSLPSFGAILFALFFSVLYVFVSQLSVRFSDWGRQLQNLLGHLLTPISYIQIGMLAGVSGFVEEWFFRGILLAHFGIVISSFIFGLCHLILKKRLWIWSLWCFVAGIAFALIYQITGSLLLCALIHMFINAALMSLLNQKAYHQPNLWANSEQ